MNLQEFACSLPVAIKCTKVGIPQESIYYWSEVDNEYTGKKEWQVVDKYHRSNKFYSAYIPQEIAQFYPKEVWLTIGEKGFRKREAVIYFIKHDGIYKVSLMIPSENKNEVYEFHREEDVNESDARCKLLVFMIDKNLTEI